MKNFKEILKQKITRDAIADADASRDSAMSSTRANYLNELDTQISDTLQSPMSTPTLDANSIVTRLVGSRAVGHAFYASDHYGNIEVGALPLSTAIDKYAFNRIATHFDQRQRMDTTRETLDILRQQGVERNVNSRRRVDDDDETQERVVRQRLD